MGAPLRLVKPERDQQLLESAERLLEGVRSGEVTGISGITLLRDGRVGYVFKGECARKPYTTLQHLRILLKKIFPNLEE